MQMFAKAPAKPQATIGFQDNLVFTVAPQFQAQNAIEIHDCGSVNPTELVSIQIALEVRQGTAQ
jgi:hypothetical protein